MDLQVNQIIAQHEALLTTAVSSYVNSLSVSSLSSDRDATTPIIFQETRKEFKGDITLVLFPLVKSLKKSPQELADQLTPVVQAILVDGAPLVTQVELVQGFLNLTLADSYWLKQFTQSNLLLPSTGKRTVVEYSSPNTNKPLHLGHIRNILLGSSVAHILQESGNDVVKVQVINDRGIHICKSMIAWKMFGNGETPESSATKGDHLIGKYYVAYEQEYQKQVAELKANGKSEDQAKVEAPILLAAQAMLIQWEAGDQEILKLWRTMNNWVYDGFDATYQKLGVSFDKNYYESETYLLGKDKVLAGLEQKLFYKKDDGSIWVDLTADKLDQKVLLRKDGTSVYMTQDIGTAIQRYEEWDMDSMIYTVGNEQDYHFKVLFVLLKRLGFDWADRCYHLSYGMVDLPSGKMKSREGTVVDADDLIAEVVKQAGIKTKELGKTVDMTSDQVNELASMIGLGAIKYFILKVEPQKRVLFNPAESIDLNGNTGPFIQYSHARICSLIRKARDQKINWTHSIVPKSLHENEKILVKLMLNYKKTVLESAQQLNPAIFCAYVYELAVSFNRFYHDCPVLNESDHQLRDFRLHLSEKTAELIKKSLGILGIQAPERM